MPKKREYVVRVVEHVSDNDWRKKDQLSSGCWLECLRYAGIVTVHREDDTGVCFDIHAPKGVMSEVWAEQNSMRMKTFGINAVRAPEWDWRGERPGTGSERSGTEVEAKQLGTKAEAK